MKIRIILACLFFFLCFQNARSTTNGFLSFNYSQAFANTEEKESAFHDVQIGLIFSGMVSPVVGYSAELHLRENRLEAQEAWLRFFSSESFRLKIGLFLVPFGKYNSSRRPYETFLIHAPLNIDYMFPSYWRDIGIVAEGRVGSVFYSVFVGNGLAEREYLKEGQQFGDNNANKGLGGRVSWLLSQDFEVGYSYYGGKIDDSDERGAVLHDVDVSWNDQNFQISVEYTKGGVENPEGYEGGDIEGFYVQTSITLQNFFPFVCFQKMKYADAYHGLGFMPAGPGGEGIELDRARWAFGVVYAPAPGVLLKLEYDFDSDRLSDIKENTITFQAALRF